MKRFIVFLMIVAIGTLLLACIGDQQTDTLACGGHQQTDKQQQANNVVVASAKVERNNCIAAFEVDGIHCKPCEKPLLTSINNVIKPTLSTISNGKTLVLKFEGDCESDKGKLLDIINKTDNAMGAKFSAKEISLTKFYVPGMECPACVNIIKEAIQNAKNIVGNLSVFVDDINDDIGETSIYISLDNKKSKIDEVNKNVIKAISDAGFKTFTVKQEGLKLDKIETTSEKIHCQECAKKIVSGLIQDKDVYKVKVNPDTKEIKVITTSDKKDDDIKKALEGLGFPVTNKFKRTTITEHKATEHKAQCDSEQGCVCKSATTVDGGM